MICFEFYKDHSGCFVNTYQIWKVKESEKSDEFKVFCFINNKVSFPFTEFKKSQEEHWKIRNFVFRELSLTSLSFIKLVR